MNWKFYCYPKLYKITTTFSYSLAQIFCYFNEILSGWSQTRSLKTFQPIISIFRWGNFFLFSLGSSIILSRKISDTPSLYLSVQLFVHLYYHSANVEKCYSNMGILSSLFKFNIIAMIKFSILPKQTLDAYGP